MNTKENEVIKELSIMYDKKEKVIRVMYEKSKEEGYTIKEFKELLEKFYCNV